MIAGFEWSAPARIAEATSRKNDRAIPAERSNFANSETRAERELEISFARYFAAGGYYAVETRPLSPGSDRLSRVKTRSEREDAVTLLFSLPLLSASRARANAQQDVRAHGCKTHLPSLNHFSTPVGFSEIIRKVRRRSDARVVFNTRRVCEFCAQRSNQPRQPRCETIVTLLDRRC